LSIVSGECGEPTREFDALEAEAGFGREPVGGAQDLKVGDVPGVGLESDCHPWFVVLDLAEERFGVMPAGYGQKFRPGAVQSIPELEFGLRCSHDSGVGRYGRF
jgi:hypothetical protein